MKKQLLSLTLLVSSFAFGQLYTAYNVVNPTSTPSSNNVGIGTYSPNSTLEVANGNGAKLTISTNGASGTSANPLYPVLEFAGYSNSPKARIFSTEESGNTSGSKFSIATNDGSSAASMTERLTILQNGNIGIGNSSPNQKLDVRGNILAGDSDATEGINAFAIRYDDGSLNNWGALRSSAATYMSFGVKASPTSGGWISSNGTLNFNKGAITINDEGIKFLGTSNPQQIPLNSTVALNEIMTISPNGNVGVGAVNPVSKLDLGTNLSAPSSFPNKINLYSAGANNYFGFGVSTGSLDYFSQAQHRFFVGYNGSPGTEVLTLKANGNAALQGKFEAKEIKVTLTPTADFVFEEDYNLPKLEEVEKHIKEKKHLPEIASAKQMEKEGVNVGEFQIKLLQKIEELTLYTIEQNKQLKKQAEEIEELKKLVKNK